MQKRGRYWNGRLAGIGGAGIQLATACLNRALDLTYTHMMRSNLGFAGKGVVIQRGVILRHPHLIALRDRVCVGRGVVMDSDLAAGFLIVDEATWIGRGCWIDFAGGLTIGKRCTLSENAVILTHNHGCDPRSKPHAEPLTVGQHVWVGANAMVLPQVREIGDDSVIGAGAVVTRSVPPRVVVAGNPARVIRSIDEKRSGGSSAIVHSRSMRGQT